MGELSIEAKQSVYLRYRYYPYKWAQVFAEFIDNAIQSFDENKDPLKVDDTKYKLRVDISFEWEYSEEYKERKAKSVTIRDNAAGISEERFKVVLNLADDEITRLGMNEFGVGMKAAAAWLGNKWHIESKSLTDEKTLVVDVDITDVCKRDLHKLPYSETIEPTKKHGTSVTLSDFWTERVFLESNVQNLIDSISSIYRCFLRQKEILLYVEDKLLDFTDYKILVAPSYKDLYGEDIIWKKHVEVDDKKGHKLSGFVALLQDTKDEHRGVVILRNRRVVMGFDPSDRLVGKEFYGQIGSAKYRRVFGELEISGFTVAFGKNSVNETELLEALCKIAAGKLKINGTSLLTQGAKKIEEISRPEHLETPSIPQPSPSDKPCDKEPQPTPPVPPVDNPPATPEPEPTPEPTPPEQPVVNMPPTDSEEEDVVVLDTSKFIFGGKEYTLQVVAGDEEDELFWNDHSKMGEGTLICKINLNQPFFKVYGEPTKAILELIKALTVAKFKSISDSGGSVKTMMKVFNELINQSKI